MITTQTHNNELYVYCDGKLIYKRWLEKNYGIVFCTSPFTAKEVDNQKLK